MQFKFPKKKPYIIPSSKYTLVNPNLTLPCSSSQYNVSIGTNSISLPSVSSSTQPNSSYPLPYIINTQDKPFVSSKQVIPSQNISRPFSSTNFHHMPTRAKHEIFKPKTYFTSLASIVKKNVKELVSLVQHYMILCGRSLCHFSFKIL